VNLYLFWFSRLKIFQPGPDHLPVTGFSIIIPCAKRRREDYRMLAISIEE
jgi:hypothetical protein